MLRNMNTKAYTQFTDNDGNEYGFESYADFSAWWFDIPHRRLKLAFSPETFKKLSYAATQSKEARVRK